MTLIKDLSPNEIWHYFDKITKIPRPSKHEEKIAQYLREFAQKHQLAIIEDKTGNIIIHKPATKGQEKTPTVILQSHMDMVCEKNSNVIHDFMTDPISTYVDGQWVKAKGTTLGADDGIGMAAQLAILASHNIAHGPLECLFTIDEETGLTGAFGLEEGLLKGSILINLDSEDDGEIFIGCAGGIDTIGTYEAKYEPVPKGYFAFKIKISGLTGGHSGDDINKGLANANKLMIRFLWDATEQLALRLASVNGGNLRNAIAREANAWAIVPTNHKEDVRVLLNCYTADVEEEFIKTEPNIKLELESAELPQNVFTETFQHQLLNSLYVMPHGAVAMSQTIPGMVETSTNLASIKTNDQEIIVSTSQRSSIESAKTDIAHIVESAFRLGGAKVQHSDGYPGWTPNPASNIVELTVDTYQSLFKHTPEVKAIHAGLECGLFLKKYPGLDMVSIGPTIKGAHSPEERLNIETVQRFWQHLMEILKKLSA
jgi:dipeptidase D